MCCKETGSRAPGVLSSLLSVALGYCPLWFLFHLMFRIFVKLGKALHLHGDPIAAAIPFLVRLMSAAKCQTGIGKN